MFLRLANNLFAVLLDLLILQKLKDWQNNANLPMQATYIGPALSRTSHKAHVRQYKNCWADVGSFIGSASTSGLIGKSILRWLSLIGMGPFLVRGRAEWGQGEDVPADGAAQGGECESGRHFQTTISRQHGPNLGHCSLHGFVPAV